MMLWWSILLVLNLFCFGVNIHIGNYWVTIINLAAATLCCYNIHQLRRRASQLGR